jgi:hypothetical protein
MRQEDQEAATGILNAFIRLDPLPTPSEMRYRAMEIQHRQPVGGSGRAMERNLLSSFPAKRLS